MRDDLLRGIKFARKEDRILIRESHHQEMQNESNARNPVPSGRTSTRITGRISEVMSKLGAKDFLYVADCALVTQTNLELMSDTEKGCHFVTKLPESYSECIQAIDRAVAADAWGDLGILSQQAPTKKRKPASYRGFETSVTLYGRTYRALVVHSDALDRRKTKKLANVMEQDCAELTKIKTQQEKISYACVPDAEAAISTLS